ncbi:GDSL-type esterase/lipase family protein [Clostridium sp. SHJSY1]|uniref:SGNH/GDSL hydrolase family protein n=1 Tax=Clostridium sp. SHJSY1 TaxID=2942483 RepID=UPI0028740201|nr:GDSL-type esterase/lipase family protein [Clostridium sp. SHJSY1]MDS0528066.1 GDSL-type esterase/lipase family protein [Clostridium sp. SHJSY1]
MGKNVKASDENVKVLGRTRIIDGIRYINYSCSGIEFMFTGRAVSVVLCSDYSKWDEIFKGWVAVFINDECAPSKRFPLESDEDIYKIFESSIPQTVKIKLVKMSEAAFAKVGIKEIIFDGNIKPTENRCRLIEFIGDSITCGYGNEGNWNIDEFNTAQENPFKAYAAKTAQHFNADFNCISWSGIGIISSWTEVDTPNTDWLMPMLYKYTDAGLDQSLGNSEYELWDNNLFKPEIIVINLGTNDNSYTKNFKDRINQFIVGYYKLLKQVRSCNPNAEIICSLGVMGQDLCPAIETAVVTFINQTNDSKIHTMRFEVQSESDGIGTDWHPSIKTHNKIAKQLIRKIESIIQWK